jgi:hypothetical protein
MARGSSTYLKGEISHNKTFFECLWFLYGQDGLLQYFFPNGLVVIVGDMNFTLEASKLWGPTSQLDPLSRYFIRKF